MNIREYHPIFMNILNMTAKYAAMFYRYRFDALFLSKIVMTVYAFIFFCFHAASLETDGLTRKGKGHCGQVFQQVQYRREHTVHRV